MQRRFEFSGVVKKTRMENYLRRNIDRGFHLNQPNKKKKKP